MRKMKMSYNLTGVNCVMRSSERTEMPHGPEVLWFIYWYLGSLPKGADGLLVLLFLFLEVLSKLELILKVCRSSNTGKTRPECPMLSTPIVDDF